jgi:HEAT repeat protein
MRGFSCRLRTSVVVLAAIASPLGCASSSPVRAAERGDLVALKSDILARQKAGSLDNREAAAIARAVAEREVRTTTDHTAALGRVRDVRACATELDDVLEDRSRTHDAAGAEAALARLDMGRLDADDARASMGDKDDAWRAVGARGLVRPSKDHAERVRAMVDPSPKVRRAAMRAAAEAKDPAEVDALAEAARVDPEGIVKTEAVRALAEIGGEATAARLRDLWVSGDDALREDIASAWSRPAIFPHGGREALRVLLASEQGPGAITAAWTASRSQDAELRTSATGLLVRTILRGSRRDRLHAMAMAPLAEKDVVDALRKGAREDDVEVKLSGWSRLLESPPDRADAVKALETLAGQNEYGRLASRARYALAEAGDLRIQAWIEKDLDSPEPTTRTSAVDALAALGRSARGAPLLADRDPAVRTRVACTLLAAARVHR